MSEIYVSPAERRVLEELLADGPSNLELKKRLGLSLDTVKSHVRNLMAKVSTEHPEVGPLNRARLVALIHNQKVEITYVPTDRHFARCHVQKWRNAGSPQPRNGPRYFGPACTCDVREDAA